ncbi:hypothetical protein CU097_006015 [Rhizopus azygosporus]|uniref:Uncharacterized protein n=2 Tax=Rhizopus TaxID=4842 RepID=A0A367JRN9_RHIAZ|nr:hypothetical protein BCV71DRAFT_94421 [Rhizopus microsporus]RCH92607.1 hypothetical protein CU097_006015 [Rhizopus azygosporus]
MNMSLCLYCEKQLLDESASFCSLACQINEASKPIHHILILFNRRNQFTLYRASSLHYHSHIMALPDANTRNNSPCSLL